MPDYIGAEAAGKAGVSVLGNNAFAVFNNPANLVEAQTHETAINHHALFAFAGLAQSSVALNYKQKTLNLGVGATRWGYDYFKYNQYTIAGARKLNEKWNLGINVSYASFNFGEAFYGIQHYVKTGLGTTVKLPKNLVAAVFIQNIHRPKVLSSPKERDETFIKAGLNYAPSEKIQLSVEALQQLNARIITRLGLTYTYNQQFVFQLGLSDNSQFGQFSFGMGQKIKQFKWFTSTHWHPVLGFSPQVGLHYAFK